MLILIAGLSVSIMYFIILLHSFEGLKTIVRFVCKEISFTHLVIIITIIL